MAWGSLATEILVDRKGQPFESRLQVALRSAAPRLRRTFREFRDDVSLTELLEESGRLIVAYEAKYGEVKRLRGFAYSTSRNVARALLRRPAVKHQLATFDHTVDGAVLTSLPSHHGTAERVERDAQLQEILKLMAPRAHQITVRKLLGFSSEEIGAEFGMSPSAVDAMYCRAKQRVSERVRASLGKASAEAEVSDANGIARIRNRRAGNG